MVDVRTQQQVQPELTGRQKARAVRLKLLHDNTTAVTVQVYAGSEEIHALLKHPSGQRLRGEFGTASEWPYDRFTQRRIMDGSLSIKPVSRSKPDSKMGVREAAALLRPKPEDIPLMQPLSAVANKSGSSTSAVPPPPKQ